MKWISKYATTTLFAIAAFATQAQTVVEYIHTDALGSPVAVTDDNQNVVERTEYEPHGAQINRPVKDGPGYTGHIGDAVTGLSYMQQRYFDSNIGRFLSVDPIAANRTNGVNFNRYSYAANNPYRFTDPDGRWVCEGRSCQAFEKALNRVKSAAVNPRLSPNERAMLQRIVAFYGKKGDDKVSISFADLGGPGGNAALRKDGGEHITLDMKRATRNTEENTLNVLGRVVSHEGEHGANDQDRKRPVSTRAERRQEEIAGYTAQAYFQKASNFSDSSSDGWTIWGGLSQRNIERQADGSVNVSCGSSTEGSCK